MRYRAPTFRRRPENMTEPTRRPILHLKTVRQLPAAAPPQVAWRCKPCGALVDLNPALADKDEVRCPSCNALLGRAEQFRSDPPQLQRVRARMVGG